jgi:hypothetical protein
MKIFRRSYAIMKKPLFLRALAIIFTHSADPWISLLLIGCLWLWGIGSWKQLALVMFIGTLLTAAVVFVFKYSVRRSRPVGEWGKYTVLLIRILSLPGMLLVVQCLRLLG